MEFDMDAQSFKDLNILTETNNSASIFSIFKNTRTMGGRGKLEEIMSNPSSDIAFVSSRRDAIKYFLNQKIELEINHNQLDLIEHYLSLNRRYLKSHIIDAAAGFLVDKIKPDADYYRIKTGIKNLIKLFKYCLTLIQSPLMEHAPALLVGYNERIVSVLEGGVFKGITLLNENKLPFYEVNRLDRLFRRKEMETLKELLGIIYEFDVYETIAATVPGKGFCFPEYIDGKNASLDYSGLFHPNITNPVKNDISLDKHNNIVFLTGSNMAGKSSMLKALGLAVYLAHIGFPVPAAKMRTTLFNGLMTTINLPDDINSGLSHYYSEVKRVKKVAELLVKNENMFVIFDEMFRGTNVKDAYDASLSIISELANIHTSIFFISTHIMELAEELKKFKNISFRYMDVLFENKKPIFTYQLKDGVSTERLGMYIVENEGIIELIKKAYRVNS